MHDDLRSICLSAIGSFVSDEQDLNSIASGEPIIKCASLDSLSLVNLIVELEEKTGISIDTDDLEAVFENLNSLVQYLDSQKP